MRHNQSVPWQEQAAPPVAPNQGMTTAVPARPATIASDVLVPLLQALISGELAAGVLALLLSKIVPAVLNIPAALGHGAPVTVDVNWLQAWQILAGIVGTVVWWVLLTDTRKLLWAIERVTGLDIDGDGEEGEPEPVRVVWEVAVRNGNHLSIIATDDLKCHVDQIVTFARAVLGEQSLAEASWKNTFDGINHYRSVRTKLVGKGVLKQKTDGTFEPTAQGMAYFRGIVERAQEEGM